MSFRRHKSQCEEAHNPWEREPKKPRCSREVIQKLENSNLMRQKFNVYPQNLHLDIYTKKAALKASPSVVSLESHSGEGVILQSSGVIIENVNTCSIVLTSANLLKCFTSRNFEADDVKVIVHLSSGRSLNGQIEAYNFYYNIAAIKIQSDTQLPTASLVQLKDAITVDPCKLHVDVTLVPHLSSFDLVPGDAVIALGRFIEPYDIMVAPGEFSIDSCQYDCKELFMASCRVTECGIGGPLINHNGEVIGICLRDGVYTAFLPINIASMWWQHYKKYRRNKDIKRRRNKKNRHLRLPCLGMEATNLYAIPVRVAERIIQKFPDVLKGVIVDKVVPGSSAESAGIKHGDVIIQFAGKKIESLLELFESTWNKVGESVEVTVLRTSNDGPLHLSMVVNEAPPEPAE
ncbi:putative protease Do-like 14 [Capsicum annuum]|uniref:putative protease Do-like 14 n=1 Tax=Capsicum annuum TaxID=4072 RepID=UPI0007BFC479|nr:putative protease Do-like 14 [Capsicum annuum]XP_016561258.1 putative protease Do-like 14 [Capsicum annuum]XP_047263456.1 putative protease Do-like 14 [Capsicum annuum]